MSHPYFVVADDDTVLGFRSIGIGGAAVNTRQEALDALEAARRRGVGILIVTQEVAAMVREELDVLRFDEALPMVAEIPGPQGPLPGRRTLTELIREAIGVKV